MHIWCTNDRQGLQTRDGLGLLRLLTTELSELLLKSRNLSPYGLCFAHPLKSIQF